MIQSGFQRISLNEGETSSNGQNVPTQGNQEDQQTQTNGVYREPTPSGEAFEKQVFEVDRDLENDNDSGTNSGIFGATFNFVNSIVGAGVIGLPYALRESGFILGILMIIVVTLLTYLSVVTMVSCGVRVGRDGYEGIMEHCFGKVGYFAVLAGMTFQGFGAMCGYMIIIGDTLTPLMNAWLGLNFSRQVYIGVAAVAGVLPLSLVKDMSSLARTSFVSVMAEALIVCIVIYKAPDAAAERESTFKVTLGKSTVFSGISTMAFSFVCQHSTFIVFNTMRSRTVASWKVVSKYSLWTACGISMAMAVAGYLAFYEDTQANVLNSFQTDDGFIDLARFLLAFVMIFTYPMENFVVRHCVADSLAYVGGMSESPIHRLHYSLSIGIWVAVLAIGLSVENLGFVFELIGAIGGTALGFMFPAMCYFQISRKQEPTTYENSLFHKRDDIYLGNLVMFFFGFFVMLIGTYQAFAKVG